MKYCAGILFFCLILVSCDRSAYEEIIFSGDVETRKHISENIFYGINPDINYYINNSEYYVDESFREAIPELGIQHYFTAYKDGIIIEFANNIIEAVYIYKNTNEHILGKYIGKNIDEIKNILGKADWNYRNLYLYFNINENDDYIKIVAYTDGEIYRIEIGADNKFMKAMYGINVDE
ncbi:MAG: hypothetical protein LBI28_11195 [Treponema sp.]|nr:hypothetical protein [Treponema sp.]